MQILQSGVNGDYLSTIYRTGNSCNVNCCCWSVAKLSLTLRPHGLQQASLPMPTQSPGVCSNLCSLSQWCYLTISCSAIPFSFCLQSLPASESFPTSQLFKSGGQSIGASASASVLPMTIQGWFPLGLIGLTSLLSKGLSRVFSSTTVWKHQFFGIQPFLWPNSHNYIRSNYWWPRQNLTENISYI